VIDRISLDRLDKLHPAIRHDAHVAFLNAWDSCNGIAKPRITCGVRSLKEQALLFAQGRTSPGKIVTWAKPGQSMHNYGLAIDFCLIVNGKEASWDYCKDFDKDKVPEWVEIVNAFKDKGFAWGGDWTKKDHPHLEKPMGYTWRELSKMAKDDNGFLIL